MNPRTHNFGAYITTVMASTGFTLLSSADGSGAEVDGLSVDRNALTRTVYRSAKVSIPFTTTLSTANSCIVICNIQDSPTSTLFTDYTGTRTSTGPTLISGSTVVNSTGAVDQVLNHVLEFEVDLGAADRFVRTQITVTMDEAAADICTVGATWIFGGPPVLPGAVGRKGGVVEI